MIKAHTTKAHLVNHMCRVLAFYYNFEMQDRDVNHNLLRAMSPFHVLFYKCRLAKQCQFCTCVLHRGLQGMFFWQELRQKASLKKDKRSSSGVAGTYICLMALVSLQ